MASKAPFTQVTSQRALSTQALSTQALSDAAHLVRRTSVGLHAERVTQIALIAEQSWNDAVDYVISEGQANALEHSIDGALPPDLEDHEATVNWWLEQLLSPRNGLLDCMQWFWHTVLTTSDEKVESELLVAQLELLRSHALGNFRDLLQGFVIDAALLQFLDGDGSQPANPNENLGRELMELFSVGRGNYNQEDVAVAARALAGWRVEDGEVTFSPDAKPRTPSIFRGTQSVWDTPAIVDALCDDPLTARHISSKVWWHLVGTEQTEKHAADLGRWWHNQDLDILALVSRILRTDEFREAQRSRSKTAFEWWASMITATSSDPSNIWDLEYLGQMPYYPPNVGGWPEGDHWLSAGSILIRTSVVLDIDQLEEANPEPWSIEAVAARCGLHDLSKATSSALATADQSPELEPDSRHLLVWQTALCCPEFNYL